MSVTAIVVCDDRPDGPDPLVEVAGDPMVVWALRGVLDCGLVGHAYVLVAGHRTAAVERACAGLPVSVRAGLAPGLVRTHADQRAEAGTGDGSITSWSGGVVLLHDAARPLAPPELTLAVVEAVRRGHPVAVPVLPMTDTVKQLDTDGLVSDSPDRSTLRVVQTPIALRPEFLRPELLTDPPLTAAVRLAASGVPVYPVPGHPLAFPVRTGWDLELAELLAPR